MLFLGPLFFYMGMRSNAQQARGSADGRVLECSREGVFVDGKLLIARSEVDNGAVVPDTREGGMLVQLGKKGSLSASHTIHARDDAEAEAILSALELDVKHSTLVHREAGWMAYSSAPTKLLGGAFALGILSFVPLLILLHGSALAAILPALGMTAFFAPLWGTRSQALRHPQNRALRQRWFLRLRSTTREKSAYASPPQPPPPPIFAWCSRVSQAAMMTSSCRPSTSWLHPRRIL